MRIDRLIRITATAWLATAVARVVVAVVLSVARFVAVRDAPPSDGDVRA